MNKNRKTGRTYILAWSMKISLEKGDIIGVLGCNDPKPLLDKLKNLGMIAHAEPMYASQGMKGIYDDIGIIGIEFPEKKQTGYTFINKNN